MEPNMSLEKEHETTLTITEISPLGYGNPDSSISYDKQRANGELSEEVDNRASELLQAGEFLVPVNETDDGCIDGRPTDSVLYITEDGEFYSNEADNHNHERAKVAGGGYITGTAMRLGAGIKGESIDQDILATGAELTSKAIFCGAHTGEHQHADGTDCGANDKMSLIFNAALQHEASVAGTTKALIETAGLEFNKDTFDEVIANWRGVTEDEAYFAESTGASRLKATQAIVEVAHNELQPEKPLSVFKQLAGDHKEDYIVINFVEGKTLSQVALADTLHEEFPDLDSKNLAQSFVVDAWRIVELAKAAVADDKLEAALYAGVMYQLATAATLTDGSLRTFIYK